MGLLFVARNRQCKVPISTKQVAVVVRIAQIGEVVRHAEAAQDADFPHEREHRRSRSPAQRPGQELQLPCLHTIW